MNLLLKKISVPLATFSLEVDLQLHARVTALFGPSGAGKTSLLNLIAGLRRAESAFIQLDDRILTDTSEGKFVAPQHRGIGYVPQDLALFPHLSVRQNLLYGRKSGSDANPLFSFERVLDVLEIRPLIARSVTDLSGGEKQRVALARALLASPQLLLLDEPLANLDLKLKQRILPFLARIRDEFNVPMLYVTHDRFETLALAEEMVVLVNGKVAQSGSVREVFSRPANLSVASFLTVETILPGTIVSAENDLVTVAVGANRLVATAENIPANTSEVHVCIRAEDVVLLKSDEKSGSPRNKLSAIVQSILREGPLMRIELDCGFTLTALLTKQACEEMNLQIGDSVRALVKAPNIHLIPR